MTKNTYNKVSPFGGIHLIHRALISTKFPELIENILGERGVRATYSYTDLLLSRSYTAFCGGECAEDVNYLRETFDELKGLKVPSPDRILAMEGELATEIEEYVSEDEVLNQINVNENLNKLLVKTALHLKVLEAGKKGYCLDFDHQFQPCEKYDSVYSYKNERGYFPGIASIGNVPVYIEGRNGNSNVKFRQLETLKRAFDLFEDNGVSISRCRMDSGSYIKEVTDYLNDRSKFYIRAMSSDSLLFSAAEEGEWKTCRIGAKNYEVCSIWRKFGEHKHRVVCYRWKGKNRQLSAITGDAKKYLFIITNDDDWEEKQIIEFYNGRGSSERLFDILNNDFNWAKLPSSRLEANTVYLLVMAISSVIYRWLILKFSKIFDFLKPSFRLKKFRFRLVCIAAKITRSGRRQVVTFFGGKRLDRLPSLFP